MVPKAGNLGNMKPEAGGPHRTLERQTHSWRNLDVAPCSWVGRAGRCGPRAQEASLSLVATGDPSLAPASPPFS